MLGLQEALRKQEAMSVPSHGNGLATHIPGPPRDWLCDAKYSCCGHTWDCCAHPCFHIFFFSSLPLILDGAWQPSVRKGGAPSAARGAIRHTVWDFLSTCAVIASQNQIILQCFPSIEPSKTASNLQLCCSNSYTKPKAKSFRI